MSILKQVKEEINSCEAGTLLTYSNFTVPQDKFLTLAKSLSILCKEGIIKRISKGIYYKPETFIFGSSLPTDSEIINTLLTKNRVKIAYITGINAYNQLGLTTQVSKEVVIATEKKRRNTKIQNTEIRFIKSKVTQNIDKTLDIPILQILDAITDIKVIPDNNVDTLGKMLLEKIRLLNDKQKTRLIDLVLLYPPSTRALVGAFLELLGETSQLKLIQNSLNILSTYNIGISTKVIPNKFKWKIK